MLAVQTGDIEIVRPFLDQPTVDVNAVDNVQYTASRLVLWDVKLVFL